jgi:hypothetical protein
MVGLSVVFNRRNIVLFPFWGHILGRKQNFSRKMLGGSESLPYLCQRLKDNGDTIPAGSGDCSEVLRAFFICPKTQSGTTPAEDILAVVFRKEMKPPGVKPSSLLQRSATAIYRA